MYAAIRDDIVLSAGFTTVAEGLADLGLSGVELEFTRDGTVHALDPSVAGARLNVTTDEGLAALKAQCASAGVRVSALLLANNFGVEDRGAEIDWVVSAAKAAHGMGAPAVRIDAIMHGERDLPLAQRQEIFHSAMSTILERTVDLGTDFGIENHGFQGNDPEFLSGLFARTDDPRLGMTMDTGNLYWAGHPLDRVYEILEMFAPRTKHTHVKNIRYPEDQRNIQRELGWEYGTYCAPIPDGDIDHTKLVGFLQAAGYDRDFTIEDESLGKFAAGEERLGVLRNEAEYVKRILA
jgi:sugar phosphate isomerase/epimerase